MPKCLMKCLTGYGFGFTEMRFELVSGFDWNIAPNLNCTDFFFFFLGKGSDLHDSRWIWVGFNHVTIQTHTYTHSCGVGIEIYINMWVPFGWARAHLTNLRTLLWGSPGAMSIMGRGSKDLDVTHMCTKF